MTFLARESATVDVFRCLRESATSQLKWTRRGPDAEPFLTREETDRAALTRLRVEHILRRVASGYR